MRIYNRLDLTPMKVFGWIIVMSVVGKVVFKYDSNYGYSFVSSDLIAQVIVLSIAYVLITFTSSTECKKNSLITCNGIAGWKRKSVYKHFDKIVFSVNYREVNNGPDKPYLSVQLITSQQSMIRSKEFTIAMLCAKKKAVVFKASVTNKHLKEIDNFEQTADQLMALYPDVNVEIGERVEDFYQAVTNKDFSWYRETT